MRLLYLDDSGKTDPKHLSRFVVFAGLSFDDRDWHTINKRITGAKAKFFPTRASGRPNAWELKTADFLRPNPWKRKKNRDFCYELTSILRRSSCSVYAIAAEKAKSNTPLNETWLVPLMFQRAVAKLIDEVRQRQEIAKIVCDWSSYKLDRHISNCVGSYAVSRGFTEIIGDVSYASSASSTIVQAADLIAGAFRIWHEGGTRLDPLITKLTALQYERPGARCFEGHPVETVFKVF